MGSWTFGEPATSPSDSCVPTLKWITLRIQTGVDFHYEVAGARTNIK